MKRLDAYKDYDPEYKDILKTGGKKEKKSKKVNLLIARKRKRKQSTTPIGEWLPGILKKGIEGLTSIQEYLQTTYRVSPSDDVKNLLNLISKSKVVNNKITLSDNFANIPMYCYFVYRDVPLATFSNDELYLGFRCKMLYEYMKSNLKNNYYRFFDNCILNKVYYLSRGFILKGREIKGIYQDYQSNFAAIGLEHLGNTNEDRIKNQKYLNLIDPENKETGKIKFTYKSIDYTAFYAEGGVVICKSGTNEQMKNEINNGIKQLKVFTRSSSKTEITFKEIKHTIKKIRYADFRLKPEGFCPSFLLLENLITVDEVYKMEFDLNNLFETLDDIYKKEKGFNFFPNLCYWDNMNTFYDFLTIYALTSKEVSENDKKLLMGYVESYKIHKDMLVLWRKTQLFGQKILKDFFYCFTSFINYEKLAGIYKRLDQYIKDFQVLQRTQDHGDLLTFLKNTEIYGKMMSTQLRDESIFSLFIAMQKVLGDLIDGIRTSDMVNDLRKLCISIYRLSVCGDVGVFPIVLSPGAFLGDLVGNEDPGNDLIKIILDKYKEGQVKQEYKEDEIRNIINDVYNNMEKFKGEVIFNNVSDFINKKGYKLNYDNLRAAAQACVMNLTKEPQMNKELEEQIINFKIKGKALGDLVFQETKLISWIQSYIAEISNQRIAQEVKNGLSQMENNNNFINNVNNNIGVPALIPNINVNVPQIDNEKKIEKEDNPSIHTTVQQTNLLAPANPPIKIKIKTNIDNEGFTIPNIKNTYDDDDDDFVPVDEKIVPINQDIIKNDLINKKINKLDKKFNAMNIGYIKPNEKPNETKEKLTPEETPKNDYMNILKVKKEEKKTEKLFPINFGTLNVDKNKENQNKKVKEKHLIKPYNINNLSKKLDNAIKKKPNKKPSQLDLELERINKRIKENDDLLKNIHNQSYHESFIEDDYNLNNVEKLFKNRKSLFKNAINNNPQYEKWGTQKIFLVDNLSLTPSSFHKILNYYRDVVLWFNSLGYETPKIFKTNKNMYKLKDSVDISDALLNEISKIIPTFGNPTDLKNEILGKKQNKNFANFKNLYANNKNLRQVREYINIDRKYWPNYKEPTEAEESLGHSESQVNLTRDSQISGDTI